MVSANGRFPSYGLDKIVNISEKYDIPIIEDAAQSLGSFYECGSHIGTIGKIGSLSFSAPKIISTGQGGALMTNDDELARKIRLLKDFGRTGGGGNDIHDTIGFNFKFTELQAVIGIEQMKKLTRVKFKKNYGIYEQNLSTVNGIKLFKHKTT